MSRIRGIEVKVHKDVLQTRNYGLSEILLKRSEDQPTESSEDAEKNQIVELLQKLPKLDRIFEVHRKIGEGTFSSVYLGSLRQHAGLPSADKPWYAIKHLVPTAHPARVEHELRCLQDIGGKENVIGVDLCLRHLDTIVFVMPYIPHRKFSEYMGEMDAEEVKHYMRALLRALNHVHSFGVIHRDVKPSNFLYDRENRRYLLVDFGLAQRLCPAPEESAPPPAHAQKRALEQEVATPAPEAKRTALDLTVAARSRSAAAPSATHAQTSPRVLLPKSAEGCACRGVAGVCGACGRRRAARAARAGTQGYRPPEVLLKVAAQGTPVDVWAAGVVLATVLTRRYPLFRAGDDVTALAELADLLGTRPLARAAAALGRRLLVSQPRRGLCLRKLACRLRGAAPPAGAPPCAHCLPPASCLCRDETLDAEAFEPAQVVAGFPDAAFSLAARLLAPDPRRRPTAAEALRHPFLAE